MRGTPPLLFANMRTIFSQMSAFEEADGLGKCEWHEPDAAGDPIVHAAFGVDEMVDHPGSGRAAYHENDLGHGGKLGIPDVV